MTGGARADHDSTIMTIGSHVIGERNPLDYGVNWSGVLVPT